MNFLLAGEGNSDLGALAYDGSIKKGAMTYIIDTIVENNYGETPEYRIISEVHLKALKK